MGKGKGGSQPAPIIVRQPAPAAPAPNNSAMYAEQAYKSQLAEQQKMVQQRMADVEDQRRRNEEAVRAQEEANRRRREGELRGQAKDIVDTRLESDRSRAMLVGTAYKRFRDNEYNAEVKKEFMRLMKMDSGQEVTDPEDETNKRKRKIISSGRGRAYTPLGETSILGA